MIDQVKKNSADQWFIIVAFSLSLLLSFFFGYLVFRYWQIDVCKSGGEVVRQGIK